MVTAGILRTIFLEHDILKGFIERIFLIESVLGDGAGWYAYLNINY